MPTNVPNHLENSAVIILNYCGASNTVSCLQSLVAMSTLPERIIVVDNCSNDDSLQVIQQHWSKLLGETIPLFPFSAMQTVSSDQKKFLLSLPVNNGYAAGNNAALRWL